MSLELASEARVLTSGTTVGGWGFPLATATYVDISSRPLAGEGSLAWLCLGKISVWKLVDKAQDGMRGKVSLKRGVAKLGPDPWPLSLSDTAVLVPTIWKEA